MTEYEQNLSPELLSAKLNYIHLRWGVDKNTLDTFMQSDCLSGLGKNAKKKFRRYLNSLEQTFAFLAQRYPLQDRLRTDPFMAGYNQVIRRHLGDETSFLNYLAGNWDERILRAVQIAQKDIMIPRRAPTLAQQQPRVTFQPVSEYRTHQNR